MIHNLKGRTLALLLTLALAIGTLTLPFGVFATEITPVDSLLLLNRDFEDRTAVTNGFSTTQLAGNDISLKSLNHLGCNLTAFAAVCKVIFAEKLGVSAVLFTIPTIKNRVPHKHCAWLCISG